ncbi:DoxX family membrane protein [Thermoleophilia bacterium SCSIO 60948]|nr:DoxX family membrane protein [Thermoleophilia bacterium SCSIO 60948]
MFERTDEALRGDAPALRTARIVGLIFIPAGLVKFVFFDWELGNFERFGLPVAAAWVVAAGLIELAGAAALVRGRWVVPAAVVLAATMVVAIAVSGIAAGDVIPSLTLAPALLAGLLFVLARILVGPGAPGRGR